MRLSRWIVTKDGQIVKDGRLDVKGFAPDTVRDFTVDAPDGDAITFLFVRGTFDPQGRPDVVAHDQFAKPFVAQPVPDEPATRDLVAPMFRVNLWRAPTDNDRGWQMEKHCALWKKATETAEMPSVRL